MSKRSLARLARAEAAAAEARNRLGETLSQFQDKLSPDNIILEVRSAVRSKRKEMSDKLVSGVVSRPVIAAVIFSGLGWALRNQPGLALLLNLFLRGSATTRPTAHSTGSRPSRPRRRQSTASAAGVSEETV